MNEESKPTVDEDSEGRDQAFREFWRETEKPRPWSPDSPEDYATFTKRYAVPIAEMNAQPDISGADSKRLQEFVRVTAREVKAVGGASASTTLELIGYIRELEHALSCVHKESRATVFKEAIKWAKKVETVKRNAARDASTDDEFAAMRLAHEADGALRVVETLEAAASDEEGGGDG